MSGSHRICGYIHALWNWTWNCGGVLNKNFIDQHQINLWRRRLLLSISTRRANYSRDAICASTQKKKSTYHIKKFSFCLHPCHRCPSCLEPRSHLSLSTLPEKWTGSYPTGKKWHTGWIDPRSQPARPSLVRKVAFLQIQILERVQKFASMMKTNNIYSSPLITVRLKIPSRRHVARALICFLREDALSSQRSSGQDVKLNDQWRDKCINGDHGQSMWNSALPSDWWTREWLDCTCRLVHRTCA